MQSPRLRTRFLTGFSPFLAACGPQSTVLDSDHDGVVDTVGWAVDENHDGVFDQIDIDMDGKPDGLGVDTDSDLRADALGIDTDGDGLVDALVRSEQEYETWLASRDGVASGGGASADTSTGSSASSGGATSATGSGGASFGTGGASTGASSALSGGASGTGTNTGGTAAERLGCTSADIFCADFEDTPAGQKPSGAPWMPENCFDSNYKKTVEAGVGIDGSQGFVTTGASSSANTCALVYDIGAQSDFWLRAFIKIGGSNPDMQHEVTFLEFGQNAQVDDPELRIGYRGDNSCSNSGSPYQGFELGATKGLNNGEDTGCTGSKTNDAYPVAGQWYCLEVHVTQGNGQLMSDLYVDDENMDFLIHSSPATEVGGAFQAQYLKVGMQSYSGAFDALTIDDVSLSTTRIPCPSSI